MVILIICINRDSISKRRRRHGEVEIVINSRTITPRRLFSHWEDVRQGIKKLVAPLDSEALLWQPEGSRASIDWIIRHLATAEAFWITGTIRGEAFTPLRRREF